MMYHPLGGLARQNEPCKFAADPYTVEDLIAFDTLSREVADFLDACVRGKANIMVAGGTGAGIPPPLLPAGRRRRWH